MQHRFSLRHASHLVRRALTSMSNRPPADDENERARTVLSTGEYELWCSMSGRDRRHSLDVLDRFDVLVPGASREGRAAALLHDVGKSVCDLTWMGRVLATIIGPRTARFARYHAHEKIGVELVRRVSARETIAILSGCSAATQIGLKREYEALLIADNL